jgi:hypothetical protein
MVDRKLPNGAEPDWRAGVTWEADHRARALPDLYQMMEEDRAFMVNVWEDTAHGVMMMIERCEAAGCTLAGTIGWHHHKVGPVTTLIFATPGSADRTMQKIAISG